MSHSSSVSPGIFIIRPGIRIKIISKIRIFRYIHKIKTGNIINISVSIFINAI